MKLEQRHGRRFIFGLAERLGMTVADIEDRMGALEFAEWMALARIENRERVESDKKARRMAQTEAAARGR